ncbi:MAG: nucleoside triphosphate pyrophosphohydrolase, partial [Clostridia bacterium]|nr:nucleoside triphosphate pyrophosphohydrolase [Clostridia bacterium]
EELGDVLMQVVFHAQMEEETGGFTFADVVNGVCQKLITRHPHVFGDTAVSGSAEVLQNWDAIKRAEKNADGQTDLLRHVPKTLPALMRAEKVQGRARRVGFDWADVSGAWNALESETEELKEAEARGDADAMADELGDVLFSAVNVARFLKVDPELALTRATDKFVRRFGRTEQLAREQGIVMQDAPIETLDKLWEQAKSEE